MVETFEELITKHTRRELEDMALKIGIENLGGTKSQLAEAIIEASKKAKPPAPKVEPLRPAVQEKPKEVQEKPKEVPLVIEQKKQPKAIPTKIIGTKGVMAKAAASDKFSKDAAKAGKDLRDEGLRNLKNGLAKFNSAVDAQTKENKDASFKFNGGVRQIQADSDRLASDMKAKAKDIDNRSKKMVEDGVKRFQAGQAEFKGAIQAQIKANAEAEAKFNSGAKEIRFSMDKAAKDFQKAGKQMRDEGNKRLQNGLKEFNSDLSAQIKENRDAAAKIGSGAAEIQAQIRSFQGDIHRYVEQDLKNYVKDFYYG